MKTEPNFETLKIDSTPNKYRVISDIYFIFDGYKYHPYLDMLQMRNKKRVSISVLAQSLAKKLESFREKDKSIEDLELWLHRDGDDKFSKYIVEPA